MPDLKNNSDEEIKRIPIIEEFLTIDKKIIETGKVSIKKSVVEELKNVDEILNSDECIVQHLPINKIVQEIPATRYEGNTLIVPVLKEIIIKQTLLVEEIRITKQSVQKPMQEQFVLRKEKIEVKHTINNNK